MKNKQLRRWLLILGPLVAAAVILWPTVDAYLLEQEESQALHQALHGKDSSALKAFENAKGERYRTAKMNRVKLGLDLRGGMYVMMEVAVDTLLRETAARETIDETFESVMKATHAQAESSGDDYLDVFHANFDRIARPKGKSLISYFDVPGVQDVTDEKVKERLREDVDGAIDQALEVIRQRIDKFGVSEPNITKQGSRRIVLELPGVNNEKEMRQLLSTTARLEFKLVRNNADIVKALYRIDAYLAKSNGGSKTDTAIAAVDSTAKDTVKKDTTAVAAKSDKKKKDTSAVAADTSKKDTSKTASADSADPYKGLKDEEKAKRYQKDHQLTSLIQVFPLDQEGRFISKDGNPSYFFNESQVPELEYVMYIPSKLYAKFMSILDRADIKKLIPSDLQLLRSAKPEFVSKDLKDTTFAMWCVLRNAELTGEYVTDARASSDPMTNLPVVMMEMDQEGAEKWADVTGKNIKKKVAIVLDDQVYSAPVVQNKIAGGSSQITGMDSPEEARLLEIVLKAGALKAPVKIVEERVVGPSLGEDSIRRGLMGMGIAFLLVVLFMGLYYSTAGMVANLAVIINVLLILAILTPLVISGGGTLTLPGIAGIILTIGMAVDANILVFERIREEMLRGRGFRNAVDEGFSKALSAIVDSNVTTFLTGLILFLLGTGPVQGFALTLMIGIVTTFFTAIVVSRAMIELMISNGKEINFGQPTTMA
ncbi:MAG: protein translocase subunit SecD [Ignavibacteria bacterium]|nr:protein translocase subunit SecD [Ignavibacteria bacterium]